MSEKILRIEVPLLPPASLSPNARVNWRFEWRDKRIYGEAVFYYAIDARNRSDDYTPFEVARIDIELVYPVKRIRDVDNAIASFVSGQNSLVRAGILKGDDHNHLHWGNVMLTVDKDRAPLTIITLTEETQG